MIPGKDASKLAAAEADYEGAWMSGICSSSTLRGLLLLVSRPLAGSAVNTPFGGSGSLSTLVLARH